jgi:guanylate kinase
MPLTIKRRGVMFVLSSPSGAGKTTLSHMLMEADPAVEFSVSVTTRPQRPGERDGIDYHFISASEFDRRIAAGDLLEWAEVFGNRYGTLRAPVERALAAGRDVLFDIDWQGTQQLHASCAADLATVFILPPSGAALKQRLLKRAQDSASVVSTRMAKAASEISHWTEYDYVFVNEDLEASLVTVRSILAAERLRRERRLEDLTALVGRLNTELAALSE